jgi:hypothetical protein
MSSLVDSIRGGIDASIGPAVRGEAGRILLLIGASSGRNA